MPMYSAYGLTLQSDLHLPELAPGTGDADIVIRWGKLSAPSLVATNSECTCHIREQVAYLAWENAGTFRVKGGREIIVDPLPGADERVIRLYLLGAALGLLLHQRQLLVLHASTVAVNGVAIAFLGDSGQGKSTTAGAFQLRGHQVMTDDVTALRMDVPPLVLPGYPQLKLWPESAECLGDKPEAMPRLHPQLEKRSHHYHDQFSLEPLPLQCIYLLGEGPTLELEVLTGQDALMELLPNWYCTRFGDAMLQATNHAAHFAHFTQLVKQVPICYLSRQYDLDAVSDIVDLVELHLADLALASV
ncbi:hypothetical protein C1752_01869 [Acaryochloris thomasi RCC1774]|uniref:HPr kinase/phosphorylase n=1 Tax=Acaryochloris thomasi RCC1774 TaxID=1764569 RepID=A0A2W1K0U7_9CYAN|nr:hypothetical protein [Acaryochloris thomasi]PZD73837.1 hypothetical protein C1752_01869 [Acaryochloris thomasi RCC1774]